MTTPQPLGVLPLAPGARGEPVADLQRRLAALGFDAVDPPGAYGPGTDGAVRALQAARGLRIDGVCGDQTWAAVVEAGYALGDRRLYLRKPMMRGDDIADLQRRLGALGFDAGKVDGIFGPDTAAALAEFQRNAGLSPDEIFGTEELLVLERLGARGVGQVAALRELAALHDAPRSLAGLRVVVGERGGLDGLVNALGRLLRRHGADALTLHHPDASQLAAQANLAGGAVFIELASLGATAGCRAVYYRGYSTASPGGQALAEGMAAAVAGAIGVPSLGAAGMAIPILRETRMPAVVCEAGPTVQVVEHGPAFVAAAAAAIGDWVVTPPVLVN